MNFRYPPGWPCCACGDYCLDGKATCGRVECSRVPSIGELERGLAEFRRPGDRPTDVDEESSTS